jgi:signal transduction histidine kinase/CheY-like chemotaxis protein
MIFKQATTTRLLTYLAAVPLVACAATFSAQHWWQQNTDHWNEFKSDYHLASAELASTVRGETSAILHKSGLVGRAPVLHTSDRHVTAMAQSRAEIGRLVESHIYPLKRTLNALREISDRYAPRGPNFLIESISALTADLQSVAADTTMEPAHWRAMLSSKAGELDFRAEQLQRFHLAGYSAANEKWKRERALGSVLLYGFLILSFTAVSVFIYLIFRQIVYTNGQLKQSQARLAGAQRIAQLSVWDWFPATDRVVVSEEAASQFELASGAGESDLGALLARIHDADGKILREKMEVTAALAASCELDFRIVRGDGSTRHLHLHGQTEGNTNAAPDMVRFVQLDVTNLIETETQLRESQKMQVLGQLTGGIAHDFNNILMVVLGNLELVKENSSSDQATNSRIDRAIDGASKAARLTHQLLAFARNQPLSPKPVNVAEVLGGIDDLLRRTLGETIDVEVVSAPEIWNCEIDQTQLENAVLNLVLNARDAMPRGGHVTLEAGNAHLDDEYAAAQQDVTPGQYVVISVTDTGTGMPEGVRAKVFEPFFTTKTVGQGTGLGLSQVYGFVKQSNGHISVDSEEGEGTTFRIYLPRSMKQEPGVEVTADTGGMLKSNGEQTIMVVEDDCDVLSVAVNMLSDLKYKVLSASDPKSALRQLSESVPVNLLLTDVVLSGDMNGRMLADEVKKRQPGIKVLYMSGYPEHGIVHHGRLEPGLQLLQKPFRQVDLARKVWDLLNEDRDSRGPDLSIKNALSA